MATLTEERGRNEVVEGDQQQAVLYYRADCAEGETEDDVRVAAQALDLYYSRAGQSQLKRTQLEFDWLAVNTWRVTATYEPVTDEEDQALVKTTGSVSTATAHIDYSIKTLGAFGPQADTSVVGNSNPINDNGEKIEGADVLAPALSISAAKTFPAGYVTLAYLARLVEFAGCVNSKAFCGFIAGTVMFTGAQFATNDDGEWEITFSFDIRKPVPSPYYVGSILVGFDGIAGAVGVAGPWDVVWSRNEMQESNDSIISVPVEVRVERVYNSVDLNLLGVTSLL